MQTAVQLSHSHYQGHALVIGWPVLIVDARMSLVDCTSKAIGNDHRQREIIHVM